MDVLEFTGIDNRYYYNERIQKFMRWLFGSSINPSKEMAIFGDMLPSQGIANDMMHRRIINFDEKAAAYAAWFHNEVAAPGHILTYILPKDKLPPPQVPKSEIYHNGGAFLGTQTMTQMDSMQCSTISNPKANGTRIRRSMDWHYRGWGIEYW